jgi:spore coat protein H
MRIFYPAKNILTRLRSITNSGWKNICILFPAALLLSGCDFVTDNNPAAKINTIPVFDTYIHPENLSNLLSNKHIKYSVPVQIFLDGSNYKGAIEAQGAGSRFHPKWNFEIKTGSNEKIFNLNNFNLSAQVSDVSMLRTMLASYVYREMGFEVFESRHAFLIINNENKGLYYFIERIGEDFFRRRNLPVYELIKLRFGARFTFADPFDLRENFEKEINDDGSLHNLETLINALDTIKTENIFGELSKLLDIDMYLKYHAVSSVIAAADGFTNNFHLYKPFPESPYKIIPWDFDGTFNPLFGEVFHGGNEIIYKLLFNDSCFNIYKNYFLYVFDNYFTESALFPLIDAALANIRQAYRLDPYLGLAGLNPDTEAQKLKDFIIYRRQLIIQNLDSFK